MPRTYDEPKPLQTLLLNMLPVKEREEPRAMFKIAEALKCTRATVYNWINDGKIPAGRAKAAVDASGARLTLADFHPFVYPG